MLRTHRSLYSSFSSTISGIWSYHLHFDGICIFQIDPNVLPSRHCHAFSRILFVAVLGMHQQRDWLLHCVSCTFHIWDHPLTFKSLLWYNFLVMLDLVLIITVISFFHYGRQSGSALYVLYLDMHLDSGLFEWIIPLPDMSLVRNSRRKWHKTWTTWNSWKTLMKT